MKKVLALLIAFVMLFGLAACGQGKPEPTAEEQLNENEKQLFDALIKITTDDFVEPSYVRVIELGDYEQRTKENETSSKYGPDTIFVHLQQKNDLGQPDSGYYIICLAGGENTSNDGQSRIESLERRMEINSLSGALGRDSNWKEENMHVKGELLEYKGEFAEYGTVFSTYEVKNDASDIFDVGKINRAIAEHWEALGLNQ